MRIHFLGKYDEFDHTLPQKFINIVKKAPDFFEIDYCLVDWTVISYKTLKTILCYLQSVFDKTL